jgi:hypothetical protein
MPSSSSFALAHLLRCWLVIAAINDSIHSILFIDH